MQETELVAKSRHIGPPRSLPQFGAPKQQQDAVNALRSQVVELVNKVRKPQGGGDGNRLKCHRCGSTEHRVADCPLKRNGTKKDDEEVEKEKDE